MSVGMTESLRGVSRCLVSIMSMLLDSPAFASQQPQGYG